MILRVLEIVTIIEQLLKEVNPYTLDKGQKQKIFSEALRLLARHHAENCQAYADILTASHLDINDFDNNEIPALAVRLFKEYELRSIPEDKIVKILTSSGTTSQTVSRIYLDRETSIYQTKVLVHIMQSFLGKKRLPMLIIDHPGVIKDRASFSARGAGILGLSTFGRDHCYALNDNMEIDLEKINTFIEKYTGQSIFIFGFTFMVWEYFIEKLKSLNQQLDLSTSILVHSGGWKKLQDKAVSNEDFKATLKALTGIQKVHNFYGMVEQVGSIFVECECGVLHAPNYSNIYATRSLDWSVCPIGEAGVITVESLLPISYPGHKLLTEDIGVILGEDDCACGRKGKYFSIQGRVPRAEVRGCSDTHQKSQGD